MSERRDSFRARLGAALKRHPALRVGAILAIIAVLIIWGSRQTDSGAPRIPFIAPEKLPNFNAYTDVNEKKAAFFNFLLPSINAVNSRILEQREHLLKIRAKVADGDGIGWLDDRWLANLCEAYDFDPRAEYPVTFLDQMAARVDVVSPSLVLAQAANESAWGTSRFAKLGNNLFGMRTYEPGTGIVPRRRAPGATWEVAAYSSVQESVRAYVHNLNTNDSYRRLRDIRRDLRRRGQPITGHALAGGLNRYSERGSEYVAIIRSMIRSNDLRQYDE